MLKLYLIVALCCPLLLGAASQAPLEQNLLEEELSQTQLRSFLESAQGKAPPPHLSDFGQIVLSEKDTENILLLYPMVIPTARVEHKKLLDSLTKQPLHDETLDPSLMQAILIIKQDIGLPADHVLSQTVPMLLAKNGGDFTKEEAIMSLEALIDLEILCCKKTNEFGTHMDNAETRPNKIVLDFRIRYTQDVLSQLKRELKEDRVIPDPIRTIPHIKRFKDRTFAVFSKGLTWVHASTLDRAHSLSHLFETLLAVQGRLKQYLDVQCIQTEDITRCRKLVQGMLQKPEEISEEYTTKQRTPKYFVGFDYILKNLNGLVGRLTEAKEAEDTAKAKQDEDTAKAKQDDMRKRISGIIRNLHKRKKHLLAHRPQNDAEDSTKSDALATIESLFQKIEALGFSTVKKTSVERGEMQQQPS